MTEQQQLLLLHAADGESERNSTPLTHSFIDVVVCVRMDGWIMDGWMDIVHSPPTHSQQNPHNPTC